MGSVGTWPNFPPLDPTLSNQRYLRFFEASGSDNANACKPHARSGKAGPFCARPLLRPLNYVCETYRNNETKILACIHL